MNGKHSCSEVNYISIWKSLFKTTIWKSLFKPRIGTKPRGSVDHGGKSIWNAIWKDYLDHDLEKLLKPSMMSIIERAKWTATLWYKSVQLINAHRSSSLGPFYVTTHLVPGDFSEPHSCSLGPLMLATFRVAFSKSYIDATIPWTTTFERCSVNYFLATCFISRALRFIDISHDLSASYIIVIWGLEWGVRPYHVVQDRENEVNYKSNLLRKDGKPNLL